MTTKFAATRALLPLCLLTAFSCSDLKKAITTPGEDPAKEGHVVVEGRLSWAIESATLPSSFEYATAGGPKTDIVTVHAGVTEGTLELLSHALRPNACKVTLALTAAEALTLKLYLANEQICRYVPGKDLVSCAYFVAEGHEYRVRAEGADIRIGGCTVEGYKYLCDSKAAYAASEFLKTVVIPSKAAADCVAL